MKFIIDRSKWRCGGEEGLNVQGKGPTRLLNREGYMCCLGMCMEQVIGYRGSLVDTGEPCETDEEVPPFTRVDSDEEYGDILENSVLSDAAMTLNDATDTTREEKEGLLTSLFAEHGHEIEFVGEYEDTTNTGTT